MTKASEGLTKALGRSASGAVVALAEMTVEDILGSLSDEQRTELSASLNAADTAASAAEHSEPDSMEPDGDPDDSKCSKCGDVKKDGKCKCKPASGAEASDSRIKVVAKAVATEEKCKGKAGLALQMLADDDFANLNADAMIKIISASASADDGNSSTDAAADAVLEAIRSNQASLGTLSASIETPVAENHGWNEIHAQIRDRRS